MSFLDIFGINTTEMDKMNKELEQLNLNKKNALYIFPFDLQSGFVDLTENGEDHSDSLINSASFFERVWTGADNGVATWEGSTNIVTKGDKLYKDYKIGKHFFGLTYTTSIDSKVGDSAFQQDFTSQTQSESFSIFIPKSQHIINKEDTLKVFLLPQISQRWMRITKIETARNLQQEEIGYWVFMETMDTSLGKTGASVFQTIQRSAPGEGYAWPIINDKKEVELDQGRLVDTGVNEVQIELLGNMMLSGLGMFGRRVGQGLEKNEIDQPHWVLPSELRPAQPTRISKASIYTPDLTPVLDVKPTLSTYFKDWKQDNQSNYDWSIKKKYEGIFDSNHDASINNEWNKKSLYDPTNRVRFPDSAKLVLKGSNSPYSQQDFTVAGDVELGTALSHNMMGNMFVTQLPMQIEESIPRKVNDLPVVGKLFGLFNFGNHGWTRTKFDNKLSHGFFGIMSRMQYKFSTEALMDIGAGNKGWLPMETFDNEKGSPIGDITSSKSTNITLKFELSDKLNHFVPATSTYKDESSHGLGNSFYWNEKTKVIRNLDVNFAIDKLSAQIVGKGDFIVTFFKDGHPVHSSKHQTNAKFIDNTRAWTNITTFSPWSNYNVNKYPSSWKLIKDIPSGSIPGGGGTTKPSYFPPITLAGANAGGDWTLSRDTWNKYQTVEMDGTGEIVKNWDGTGMLLPKTNGTYKMTAKYSTGIYSGLVFYDLTLDNAHATIHIWVEGDLKNLAPANEVIPPVITLKTTA